MLALLPLALACQSDMECVDANPCTRGMCRGGACTASTIDCGFPCEAGKVCNGEKACVTIIPGEGGYCLCDGMCQLGSHCSYTKCVRSTCPDGRCEHECGLCDEDCSKATCKNNHACDVKLGENCRTDPTDCPCYDRYCDPKHERADERGCYELVCGDGRCELPFESPRSCCNDCGCGDASMACNATTRRCEVRCGDGRCEPDECLHCHEDCTPALCNDTACAPAIGETCLNSLDCVCKPVVSFSQERPSVEEGKELALYFDVANDGNTSDTYVVDLINGSFEMKGWFRQIRPMEPGDSERFPVHLFAPYLPGRDTMSSDIIVKVRSEQAQQIFTTRRSIDITPMGFFWWLIRRSAFRYLMRLNNLTDYAYIVLLPLIVVYYVGRYLRKRLKLDEQPATATQQWTPAARPFGPPPQYAGPPQQYVAVPPQGPWQQQRPPAWPRR